MALLLLSAAWVIGLLAGLHLSLPLPTSALLSTAAFLLALLLRSRGLSPWPALLALVGLLGLLRVQLSPANDLSLRHYAGVGTVTLEGMVVQDPDPLGDTLRLVVDGRIVGGGGTPLAQGKVMVLVRPPAALSQSRGEPALRYGDRLRLEGRLSQPPVYSDFDYREYLARQGIAAVMYYPEVYLLAQGQGSGLLEAVFALRHRLAEGLEVALPGEQAAVAQAMLLGLRREISPDLNQAFRATGTSHVLAVSGMHLSVVLGLTTAVSQGLLGRKRHLYLLPPLAAIWGYSLLTGFAPSVQRSAIMGTVYLAAQAAGRPSGSLPSLALAGAVMAGLDPALLQDVSFQLSFTSMAGLALVAPSLAGRMGGHLTTLEAGQGALSLTGRFLVEGLASSLAATLATLPIIAFNFHQVSAVGIPATILLLPVLTVMLVTCALAAMLGAVSEPAGQVAGWAAFAPLAYMTALVQGLSRVPFAAFDVGRVSGLLVWLYYGALAGLALAPWKAGLAQRLAHLTQRLSIPGPGLSRGQAVLGLALASASVLSWSAAITAHDGRLHVHFLDVGQGDAVFVVTPRGKQVLIDGGPGALEAVKALGERMPFWDRSLDLVVATHPQEDHITGLLEVLRRYRVGQVLVSPVAARSDLQDRWDAALAEDGAPVLQAAAGQRIPLEEGLVLEVLHPPPHPLAGTTSDLNNNGVVLRLAYGGLSFLFAADIQQEAEGLLAGRGAALRSTVLKVPHHGSRTSSSPAFLRAVAPPVAVVQVGDGNPFGHPHPEVLERLEDTVGLERLFLTSRHGDIHLTTDGRKLWVRTQGR